MVVMSSCSSDYLEKEEPVHTFVSSYIFEEGEDVGFFSTDNNNIRFVATSSNSSTTFSGKLDVQTLGEYTYLAYPYIKGASPDIDRKYTFTLEQEQSIESYEGKYRSPYAYKVGYSVNTKSASNYEFQELMAQMDIVIANNTASALKVNRVIMSEKSGKEVFSTSASMTMNPHEVNFNDYQVAAPSQSALSVKVSNPSDIQTGNSRILTLMFFPTSVEHATELTFTIETNMGIYNITKTIGGLSTLKFKRGERYITPLSVE